MLLAEVKRSMKCVVGKGKVNISRDQRRKCLQVHPRIWQHRQHSSYSILLLSIDNIFFSLIVWFCVSFFVCFLVSLGFCFVLFCLPEPLLSLPVSGLLFSIYNQISKIKICSLFILPHSDHFI